MNKVKLKLIRPDFLFENYYDYTNETQKVHISLLGSHTDLIVDWIEQQCARLSIKNEAKTSIVWGNRK